MNNCDKIRLATDAYIKGLLPEEEMRSVTNHLESCPECKNVLIQSKKVSAILHKWADITPKDNFIEAVNEKIDELGVHEYPEVNLFYRLRYAFASAAVILLAVVIWLASPKPPETIQPISLDSGTVSVRQDNQSQEATTKGTYYIKSDTVMQTAGTKAVLSLADRTKIEMDRQTALNITQPSEKSRGNILLHQGSIYLDVAKNPKTLYVETESGRIKVVGTRFRVNHLKYNAPVRKQIDDNVISAEGIKITTVSVDEGTVQVEWKNSVHPVKAGERVAFSISIKPIGFDLPVGDNMADRAKHLLELLKQFSERNDFDKALAAEAILTGMGEETIPSLMEILKSTPSGKYNSVYLGRVLSRVGSEKLYPELEAIIKSSGYYIEYRSAAAETLVGINPSRGAIILLDIFANTDTDTRKLCLTALQDKKSIGAANTAELIKILVNIIKKGESKDNPLFNAALESLAGISDNSALPLLYELLKNETDYRIILSASRAIVRLGDKSDREKTLVRLYALSEDKNDLVKLATIKTIMSLENAQGKQRLVNRLVDIGLASTDPKVKLACLETAVILGDTQAFELLKNIIAQGNSDLTLQAIQKIARITSSDAFSGFSVELLVSGYYDLINRWKRTQDQIYRNLADQITRSLQGIKNQRSLPVIRGLLDSNEPDLVLSAVRILANIGEKEDIFTLRTLLGKVTNESMRGEIITAIATLRTTLDIRDE
ncbi:MAG: FecR domain-containing protein [Planctomycetes bacterium]|nr:FecR domain-containing protein [Planctomycetota bacterium]